MLNLVRLDGEWYVVDVGMGVFGPHLPYPLKDGYETESIAPRKIRVQWRSIAEHAAEREEDAQKLWCFDACFQPDHGTSEKNTWTPVYCFTETEFLPQDYEMMSWFTSTSPRSFFTYVVLCMKMLMDDDGEKIIGDVSMTGNRVRKTMGPMVGGEKELLKELNTEQDRVDALKEIFGVELTPEERDGISPGMRIQ